MINKRRLSATIDDDVLAAAQAAVDEGRTPTISAWVNDALRLKAAHEERLRALDEFIAAYEADNGEITDDEMQGAVRDARARAVVVRRKRPSRRP